jgi:hypothetical protein
LRLIDGNLLFAISPRRFLVLLLPHGDDAILAWGKTTYFPEVAIESARARKARASGDLLHAEARRFEERACSAHARGAQ